MEITKHLAHFERLFGETNSVNLPSLRERIDILLVRIRGLQDAIRKGQEDNIMPRLGSVSAFAFAVANHFHGSTLFPLAQAMSSKYPIACCGYCGHHPCVCSEKRPPREPTKPDPRQNHWSLLDYQRHLNNLYGERNREKGIEYVLNRLTAEVAEIIELSARLTNLHLTPTTLRFAYAQEIADVFAWIIAVANMYHADLMKLLKEMYARCPKCDNIPCECPWIVATCDHTVLSVHSSPASPS